MDDAACLARGRLHEHDADVGHGRERERERAEGVLLRDEQAPPRAERDLVEGLAVDAALGAAALPLAVPPLARGAALGHVVNAQLVQLVEALLIGSTDT